MGALILLSHSPVMLFVVTFALLGWISTASGLECWESQINIGHSGVATNNTPTQSSTPRKLVTCKDGEVCYSQFTQFQNDSWYAKEFKQGCRKVEDDNLNTCQCKNGVQHSDKVHDRVCTCSGSQCSDVSLDYRNKYFDCSAKFIIPDPEKTDVCPAKPVQCYQSSKMSVKGQTPKKEVMATPSEMITCPHNHVCAATFNYYSSPLFNQSFAKRECMPSPKPGSICSCSNGTKHDPANNIKERTCLCTTTECSKPAEWYFAHFNQSDEVAGLTEPTDSTVCIAEPPPPVPVTVEPSTSRVSHSTTEPGPTTPKIMPTGCETTTTTGTTSGARTSTTRETSPPPTSATPHVTPGPCKTTTTTPHPQSSTTEIPHNTAALHLFDQYSTCFSKRVSCNPNNNSSSYNTTSTKRLRL